METIIIFNYMFSCNYGSSSWHKTSNVFSTITIDVCRELQRIGIYCTHSSTHHFRITLHICPFVNCSCLCMFFFLLQCRIITLCNVLCNLGFILRCTSLIAVLIIYASRASVPKCSSCCLENYVQLQTADHNGHWSLVTGH